MKWGSYMFDLDLICPICIIKWDSDMFDLDVICPIFDCEMEVGSVRS